VWDSNELLIETLHCLPGLEVLEARRSSFQFALRERAEYTIVLVEGGQERFVHRGKPIVAFKGNIILINPNEAHDGERLCGKRSFSAIYPSSELLLGLLPHKAHSVGRVFREPLIDDPSVASKFSIFVNSALSTHTPLGMQCMFLELMFEIFAKYASDDYGWESRPGLRAKVLYARDRLASSPEQTISLKQLAEETRLTPLALLRSFQRHIGCTPHTFQISQRLRKAKSLLRSGQSITETALDCGFVDQSHFTNTLRRWTGLTPAEYVRSIRPGPDLTP
jgi:AraC-like DNA-binding protein